MSTVAVCAAILGLISVVLVVHKKYEDGLIGKIALGVIIVMAIVIAGGELAGAILDPLAIDVLLAAIVAFFMRHTYRFFRWSTTGQGEWRCDRRRTVVFWPHEMERRTSSEHRSA